MRLRITLGLVRILLFQVKFTDNIRNFGDADIIFIALELASKMSRLK